MALDSRPRLAFVVENHLGHATYAATLIRVAREFEDIVPLWILLDWGRPSGPLGGLPPISGNWTLSASVRARTALERIRPQPDALFFHTNVTAALSDGLMRRIPTVLSTDATPKNIDQIAGAYNHSVGRPMLERAKDMIARRPFVRAEALVLFSEWAKRSAVEDYGVEDHKAVVIYPGVDLRALDSEPRSTRQTTRFLFVGGDFERKGGDLLLKACDALDGDWELDIVTKSDVPESDRVRVHRNMTANSGGLYQLFREADVFVLPTVGDAMPFVIQEAMAARLPVISTSVGGIAELVIDGDTGLCIEPGNTAALVDALQWMLQHPEQRIQMGERGRLFAEAHLDADVNARRIIGLVRDLALSHGRGGLNGR